MAVNSARHRVGKPIPSVNIIHATMASAALVLIANNVEPDTRNRIDMRARTMSLVWVEREGKKWVDRDDGDCGFVVRR